jgi:hypothetical protein
VKLPRSGKPLFSRRADSPNLLPSNRGAQWVQSRQGTYLPACALVASLWQPRNRSKTSL